MTSSDSEYYECSSCGNPVKADDDFCPQCGDLFAEDVFCANHADHQANGVCIICAVPLCSDCGGVVAGRFLCNHHSYYEIYEGMVRVFGSLDDVAAQYAKTCLEQATLHPVLFCRRQPKGGPRFVYTLYSAGGDFDGHIVNEIKVMVPSQEVGEAEKVLASLNIIPAPNETA
jgi:ribosomal protein S27AE